MSGLCTAHESPATRMRGRIEEGGELGRMKA